MGLQPITLSWRFQRGMNSRGDDKLLDDGSLTVLENAIFKKNVSLSMRDGYSQLPDDAQAPYSIEDFVSLGCADNTELLAFSTAEAYSRSSNEEWSRIGPSASVAVSHKRGTLTVDEQSYAEMAELNGLKVNCWEEAGAGTKIRYALTDSNGKQILGATTLDTNGQGVRAIPVGDYIHIYWYDQGIGIKLKKISPAAPYASATAAATTLFTNVNASTPYFDVKEANGKALIAFNNDAGTITVSYITEGGTVGSSGVGLPNRVHIGATGTAVALAYNAEFSHILLLYHNTSSAAILNIGLSADTFVILAGPTTVESIAAIERLTAAFRATEFNNNRGIAYAFWEVAGATADLNYVQYQSLGLDFTGTTATVYGASLASHAAADDYDNIYVNVLFDAPLWGIYWVLRVHSTDSSSTTAAQAVAHYLSGQAGEARTKPQLASLHRNDDGFYLAVQARDRSQTAATTQFGPEYIQEVQLFAPFHTGSFEPQNYGLSTYIAGGQMYDGTEFVHSNFFYAPDKYGAITISGVPTAGALADTDARNYLALYSRVNARGETEYSALSSGTEFTNPNPAQFRSVSIKIPTYRVPGKTDCNIDIFRTLAGDSSVYYQVNETNEVKSSPSQETIEFIDSMSDTLLETRTPLYTTGGILENYPLPATKYLARVNNRFFMIDPSDPNKLFFTKQWAPGLGVEFHPEFTLFVDSRGGAITGLAGMDDKIIIFKENAVYYTAGEGPNAANSADQYPTPVLISSDVGCINPKSILLTPKGLIFFSRKGFTLLTRGTEQAFIGLPVADDISLDYTITGAALDTANQLALFQSSDGKTLAYCYTDGINQWTSYTNHQGQAMTTWQDKPTYLRNNGQVWQQNDTNTDAGGQIKMKSITPWLSYTNEKQKLQRIWHLSILGTYISPHTLRVKLAYNYNPAWIDTFLIPSSDFINTDIYGDPDDFYGDPDETYGGGSQVYQAKIHIGRECEAIKISIENLTASGTAGGAFELSEICLSGGVVSNFPFPLSPTRMY